MTQTQLSRYGSGIATVDIGRRHESAVEGSHAVEDLVYFDLSM